MHAGSAHGLSNRKIDESLILDRLVVCLGELKQGRAVLIPRAPWTEDLSLRVDPAPLVLVDGFLLCVCKDICASP